MAPTCPRLSPQATTAGDPITVRVVEYTLGTTGGPTSTEHYRLVTTLLDPDRARRRAGRLYAQRWEIETALDELKTHQRGAKLVLRSKLPRRGGPRRSGASCSSIGPCAA